MTSNLGRVISQPPQRHGVQRFDRALGVFETDDLFALHAPRSSKPGLREAQRIAQRSKFSGGQLS